MFRVTLEEMLRETEALLDGTSPVTRWRMKMLDSLENTLGL